MNKVIKIFVTIIALAVFVFSGWKIYEILSSRHMAKEHYKSYDKFVAVNTESTEETYNKENKNKKEKIKCDIEVDFEKLSMQYPYAVGWIYIKDTIINYPVMQTKDNSYYLTRLPDGSINASGSIFADYRNTKPTQEDNYIIYGHNMKNDTMFGSLNEYKSTDFYNSHPYFYYLTPEKTYKVNIIAGCDVNMNSEIYSTNYAEEKDKIVNELISKSAFKPLKEYKESDKLITLSTCAGSSESRFVIVGTIEE